MYCIRPRGHNLTLVNGCSIFDVRKQLAYYWILESNRSERTIHEWDKLSTDCANASSANMFKN